MAENRGQESGRGRESKRPGQIPRRGWRDILLRTWGQIGQDNVGLVAAGVAFYGLLGLFPAIAALVSIYGLIADPAQVQQQVQTMSGVMPEELHRILGEQMGEVAASGARALSIAVVGSLALALWSASKGTKTLMTAMNVAYNEDERRNFLVLNLTALGLTAFFILLFVAALVAVVFAPALLAALGVGRPIAMLGWPLIIAVLLVALAILYRFGPSREQAKWRWISPGSIAAVVLWLAASVAFSTYVRNFGSYNETYGSLGAVVGLMMWLWISAFIVVMGAELNAESERQTRRDTTTGDPRPMGERGAYVADTVGERP
ncbi:MAG: YihY/virulence factor BrkB family protein [Rhodospirillales bacterium]|jgi:membrane protein|nr:YihY/virulence factor BrkB family protein [Rhodospirillales bacterium]